MVTKKGGRENLLSSSMVTSTGISTGSGKQDGSNEYKGKKAERR